jgi:hypothetical protein
MTQRSAELLAQDEIDLAAWNAKWGKWFDRTVTLSRRDVVYQGPALKTTPTVRQSEIVAPVEKRLPRGGETPTPRKLYADSQDSVWVTMAAARGVKLPIRSAKCTTAKMRSWWRKLGFSDAWFRDWTGFDAPKYWIEHNPTWNLRSFVGLLLEELP